MIMKQDELDEEFQNTFGYSGRCEGYDDDNIVNNVAYKTNFKNRNKQQIRYIAQ